MNNKKYLIFSTLIFAFVCVFYATAWTGPTNTPPDENAPAPINVSDYDQTKEGAFSLKKYLRLEPTQSSNMPSEPGDGIVFYDISNNAFKCRENGNWLNCVGGFFTKLGDNLISLLDFGSGRVRITNVATPAGDEDSDVATVGYVKSKISEVAGLAGVAQSWQMYDIVLSNNTHDGNFGGWPGVDAFCQSEFSNECVGFSREMISASYVGGSPINFGTWDTNLSRKPIYINRAIQGDIGSSLQYYSGLKLNNGYYIVPASSCNGLTSNASLGLYSPIFLNTYNNPMASDNISCSIQQRVLCACPAQPVKRWAIKITEATHDGNFDGVPGIDRFCMEQLGANCKSLSNDIIHSSYYNGPRLNYAPWNDSLYSLGWFNNFYIQEDSGSGGVKGSINYYQPSCSGWTSNSSSVVGYLLNKNGTITSNVLCNTQQHVLCACAES